MWVGLYFQKRCSLSLFFLRSLCSLPCPCQLLPWSRYDISSHYICGVQTFFFWCRPTQFYVYILFALWDVYTDFSYHSVQILIWFNICISTLRTRFRSGLIITRKKSEPNILASLRCRYMFSLPVLTKSVMTLLHNLQHTNLEPWHFFLVGGDLASISRLVRLLDSTKRHLSRKEKNLWFLSHSIPPPLGPLHHPNPNKQRWTNSDTHIRAYDEGSGFKIQG